MLTFNDRDGIGAWNKFGKENLTKVCVFLMSLKEFVIRIRKLRQVETFVD